MASADIRTEKNIKDEEEKEKKKLLFCGRSWTLDRNSINKTFQFHFKK